jgi:hypothetical protein
VRVKVVSRQGTAPATSFLDDVDDGGARVWSTTHCARNAGKNADRTPPWSIDRRIQIPASERGTSLAGREFGSRYFICSTFHVPRGVIS